MLGKIFDKNFYDYKNYNDTKKAKEYAAKYIGQTMEYNCSSYEIKKQ